MRSLEGCESVVRSVKDVLTLLHEDIGVPGWEEVVQWTVRRGIASRDSLQIALLRLRMLAM